MGQHRQACALGHFAVRSSSSEQNSVITASFRALPPSPHIFIHTLPFLTSYTIPLSECNLRCFSTFFCTLCFFLLLCSFSCLLFMQFPKPHGFLHPAGKLSLSLTHSLFLRLPLPHQALSALVFWCYVPFSWLLELTQKIRKPSGMS